METPHPESVDPIREAIRDINVEVERLNREARGMQWKHQFFTVTTILLGVAAPAVVTFSPPEAYVFWWKILAIVVTAFASASATIRTVLRYGDRFSNSALTALSLEGLADELNSARHQILTDLKESVQPQKLYQFSSWGRQELYRIKKDYVEKEVAATTKDKPELSAPPNMEQNQKVAATPQVHNAAQSLGQGTTNGVPGQSGQVAAHRRPTIAGETPGVDP